MLGGVAVGGLPTPGAYAAFARGLVDGWADLLSSAPPADITEQLRALPFTVAWLAAAIGGEIARHSRRPGLPAIGPILALALSLLFTIEERWLALAQGAGILAGTLLLITAGQRLARRPAAAATSDEFDAAAPSHQPRPPDARRRRRRRRGRRRAGRSGRTSRWPRPTSASTCAATRCRRSTRSPCRARSSEVKASLKDDRKDDVVFTVVRRHAGRSLAGRRDDRLRRRRSGPSPTPTATPTPPSSCPSTPSCPTSTDPLPEGSTTVEHTVEINDLGGHFLPDRRHRPRARSCRPTSTRG